MCWYGKRVPRRASCADPGVQQAVPRDVEDLAALGKSMRCCPYYGGRSAIAAAEVVALPYSMLLSQHTRETLGLKLHGCVVVVDEGHNLVDAINQTHSAQLRMDQASHAHAQLSAYVERYRRRVLGKNTFFCEQLLLFLRQLVAFMKTAKAAPSDDAGGETKAPTRVMSLAGLLAKARLGVNLYKLRRYLERSHLARKVRRCCQCRERV